MILTFIQPPMITMAMYQTKGMTRHLYLRVKKRRIWTNVSPSGIPISDFEGSIFSISDQEKLREHELAMMKRNVDGYYQYKIKLAML